MTTTLAHVRPSMQRRPLSEIEVRQAISHELAAAGYNIDADQVGWIIKQYQIRLAAAFGRACVLTGQVQR